MSFLDDNAEVAIKFTEAQARKLVSNWEQEVLPRCSNSQTLKLKIEAAKEKIDQKFRK